jgi:hypothetical protein
MHAPEMLVSHPEYLNGNRVIGILMYNSTSVEILETIADLCQNNDISRVPRAVNFFRTATQLPPLPSELKDKPHGFCLIP